MTVRELVRLLKSLPEDLQDLPAVCEYDSTYYAITGYRILDTAFQNAVHEREEQTRCIQVQYVEYC